MKAVVAAFNQEKALVGAFSVITNLRMELFQALLVTRPVFGVPCLRGGTMTDQLRLHEMDGPSSDLCSQRINNLN